LILGTIGSLDMRYKGQHHVIRAIHDLYIKGFNNIEYHLVGGGEGKYLKKLVNKLGLNHVVKFIGALPHNEVYSWLDSIDLYIQPSLTEGLPRALIEAMSRGCPCIASSAGGNPELIDKDYIFRKGNIRKITEHIVKSTIIENMIEQSYLNFKKSKQYESEHLDRQRENYIRDCLQ
jgi:glycosyltransferase involved in cell wall biosynthesis